MLGYERVRDRLPGGAAQELLDVLPFATLVPDVPRSAEARTEIQTMITS